MANHNRIKGQLQHFKKVLAVQNAFLENHQEGVFKNLIFKRHIRDVFFISERTFWRYLDTNAKREIKRLEKELKKENLPEMVENTN